MEKGLTFTSNPEVSGTIRDALQNILFNRQTDPIAYIITSILQNS